MGERQNFHVAFKPSDCGDQYAPRMVRTMLDGKTFLVAFKDGSMWIWKLKPEENRAGSVAYEKPITRKLVEGQRDLTKRITAFSQWSDQRVICGTHKGLLFTIDTGEGSENDVQEHKLPYLEKEEEDESIRYIGWLGETHMIISFSRSGSLIFRRDKNNDLEWPQNSYHFYNYLPGVACSAKVKENKYLLVSYTCRVWTLTIDGDQPFNLKEENPWKRMEKPGYVEDFALIKPIGGVEGNERIHTQKCRGIFLSSDLGIIEISNQTHSPGNWEARMLHLPNMTHRPMAISHFGIKNKESVSIDYLWVSDVKGDMRLYYRELKEKHKTSWDYMWSPIRILHTGTQTMRCYASWHQTQNKGFLLVQSLRDNRVAVSHYARVATPDKNDQTEEAKERRFLQLIHRGIGSTRELKELGLEEIDERTEIAHRVVIFLEFSAANNTTQGSNFLEILLDAPAENLIGTTIGSLYKEVKGKNKEEKEIQKKIRRTLHHWVYTIMALIQDGNFEIRSEYHLKLVRWLRSIMELNQLEQEETGKRKWSQDKTLDYEIYKLIMFVRKWGIYRKSLEQRHNLKDLEKDLIHTVEESLRQPKTEINPSDVNSRLPDALAVRGMLFQRQYDMVDRPSWKNKVLDAFQIKQTCLFVLEGEPEIATQKEHQKISFILNTKSKETKVFHLEKPIINWHHGTAYQNGNEIICLAIIDIYKEKERRPYQFRFDLRLGIVDATEVDCEKTLGEHCGKQEYCLIQFKEENCNGKNRVACGSKGVNGTAKIDILTYQGGEKPKFTEREKLELTSMTPELPSDIGTNEITSVHWLGSRLLVGCQDGQIWEIENKESKKVAYMGFPVTAVTQTENRIFAGTENGIIQAWDRIKIEDILQHISLWTTQEKRSVLALYNATIEDEPMVIAVTRNGRIVIFDNKDKAKEPKPGEPGRLQIAGCRRARIKLNTLIKRTLCWVELDNVLEYIDEEGKRKAIEIILPDCSKARRKSYKEMMTLFSDEFDGGNLELLRMTEAIEGVCKTPIVFLARMVMNGDLKLNPTDIAWLPKRIQPIYEFMTPFNCGSEKNKGYWPNLQHETITKLREGLLALVQRENIDLYKEVIGYILKRCNHVFFHSNGKLPNSVSIEYNQLLNIIQETNKEWYRVSAASQFRVQMYMAKNLMDGDALWAVSRQGKKAKDEKIYKERVAMVYRLLSQGDSIMAMETLRACNYSLLRAAQRLVPENELDWYKIHKYLRAVGDFAARMVGQMDGVLRHEIVRSFTLGICVCPRASIPIANIMWESKVEQHFLERIKAQWHLLHQDIYLGDPDENSKVGWQCFRFASTLQLDVLNSGDFNSNPIEAYFTKFRNQLEGSENGEAINILNKFIRITTSMDNLTKRLNNDAKDINLKEFKDNLDYLKGDPECQEKGYKHSYEFWINQLELIANDFEDFKKTKNLQPKVVLAIQKIHTWTGQAIDELDKKWSENKIFEPEMTNWKTVLGNLKAAANHFPRSTAAHQNILLASLGHGLLENLDEHLFEMEEIAQALDPIGIWDFDDVPLEREQERVMDIPQRLARYLMKRSRNAESIPKNLRTLQFLFKKDKNVDTHLNDLISSEDREPYKWATENYGNIKDTVVPFLRLALEELRSNDRIHGKRQIGEGTPKILDVREDNFGQTDLKYINFFKVQFPIVENVNGENGENEANKTRMNEIFENKPLFQEPATPDRDRSKPSHGLGLYLANLALSMANWYLDADYCSKNNHITFTLGEKQ